MLTSDYYEVGKVALTIASLDASNLLLQPSLFDDQSLNLALGLSEDELHASLFTQESRVNTGLGVWPYVSAFGRYNKDKDLGLNGALCQQW